ncbi:shikimate dehydrogenase (NADP(+)) [Acrocarpospora corrugata]|uniref:Shikimate dehydrogenase (NADP(+)) n=1 Tax=Acrocarpospora corrugata TaxID=35763 RepID=A0A5M3W221_9ACTN|nr:shikimate dehydrogenase [Acrocarpospora corrugata]GES01353.1 shikimate dehydrogenase (NADP(+)) [Acrocarpospora corrugata]
MASYLIGLIGSGIGLSLSPLLHEREADCHGVRYLYRVIDIDVLGVDAEAAGDLVRTGRRLGFDGFNITHPCKQTVLTEVDELASDAATLGAVNTILFAGGRTIGHNTDWTGFARAFTRGLPGAPLRRVVQLGAGGAGAAVAYALGTLGAEHVSVIDAEPGRARALVKRLGNARVEAADPSELPDLVRNADGLVHATPTGMAHSPGMPLPAGLLRPDLWVADIVYRPMVTELLHEAGRRGCRTLNGGGMVVFQAADAFHLFTGLEPDTERMFAHFTDLIRA